MFAAHWQYKIKSENHASNPLHACVYILRLLSVVSHEHFLCLHSVVSHQQESAIFCAAKRPKNHWQ